MAVLTGSCLCGNVCVKLVVDMSNRDVSLCHCTLCRKTTSTAFTTNIVVDRSSLTITSAAKPRRYILPGERTGSGNPADLYFCGDCGTAIWSQSMSSMGGGGKIAVKTGVLDEGAWDQCAPDYEVWACRKAKWMETGQGNARWESWSKMPSSKI